jgi:hypothetical protein
VIVAAFSSFMSRLLDTSGLEMSESSTKHSVAVATLFQVRESAQAAFLQGISTCPRKKAHFSGLFRDFSLRSPFSLAIVLGGPSFSRKNKG